MWINEETLKTYRFVHEVRADFTEVSLPPALTDEMLASIGVLPVEQATPAYNPITHAAVEIAPERVRARNGDGTFASDDPATDADEAHTWEQRWQVYALPVEEAEANMIRSREQKWEAIKAERDRRKYLGVKVGAHWFHSDDPSRIQQLALVMMGAGIPPGLQWKTFTLTPPPVFVTMTQSLAQQIFQATALSDQSIFAVAESHKIAIEASDRPDLYDFSSGWPATIYDEAGQ